MKSFRKKWNNFPFRITNHRQEGENKETMEKNWEK